MSQDEEINWGPSITGWWSRRRRNRGRHDEDESKTFQHLLSLPPIEWVSEKLWYDINEGGPGCRLIDDIAEIENVIAKARLAFRCVDDFYEPTPQLLERPLARTLLVWDGYLGRASMDPLLIDALATVGVTTLNALNLSERPIWDKERATYVSGRDGEYFPRPGFALAYEVNATVDAIGHFLSDSPRSFVLLGGHNLEFALIEDLCAECQIVVSTEEALVAYSGGDLRKRAEQFCSNLEAIHRRPYSELVGRKASSDEDGNDRRFLKPVAERVFRMNEWILEKYPTRRDKNFDAERDLVAIAQGENVWLDVFIHSTADPLPRIQERGTLLLSRDQASWSSYKYLQGRKLELPAKFTSVVMDEVEAPESLSQREDLATYEFEEHEYVRFTFVWKSGTLEIVTLEENVDVVSGYFLDRIEQ